MDDKNLWNIILADLELQVSKAVFQTLLAKTSLLDLKNETAIIGCQKPMLVNLIENRYADIIKKTLDNYTKKDIKLVFTTSTVNPGSKIDGPLFTAKLTTLISKVQDFRLNPDYTFNNFAVSSSNQMAYAAATAVAGAPGVSYNPLFLYGGVGVGKTHLTQAIGHAILAKKQNTNIIYCTGEEFTNEIIEAISTKTTSGFKKKYRQPDLLMIDDIQFIAGKYSIQEEFFHTFNAIHQVKKQIVLISDRPPEEINKLEERLRSRFEQGLTIDIGPPDFELRTAILLIKAKQRKIELPMDVAKLIASNVDTTRKLEGVLIRVLSESEAKNIPIDIEFVKNIMGKTVKTIPEKTSLQPQFVMSVVASFYNLKLSQLKSAKRDRILALPRQILYYLLRVEVGMSLLNIGEFLGGRDHTTVLYGVRKITNLLSLDGKIREDIMGIKNRFLDKS